MTAMTRVLGIAISATDTVNVVSPILLK